MAASKARISFLIILGALMSITSLSTDIYLPALPTMEATLGGDSELTITGFLVGFSLAQLLWGPISDRIGRKIPLIIGIILFIIARDSIGPTQAPSAWNTRQKTTIVILVDVAQPMLPMMKRMMPILRGIFRPIRSLIGPHNNWASENPMRKPVIVSSESPPNAASMVGSAGR